MKRFLLVLAFGVFLGQFLSVSVPAQETAENLAGQCTPELARGLVQQQVDGSKTMEATDKRIKILLRAADFLWTIDEPTARKDFSDALDLARERFKEKGVEEKRAGRGLILDFADYRFRVLAAIAKRDSAWAQRLTEDVLRETETAAKEKQNDLFGGDGGRLLDIAQNLLKINKQNAFQFARRAVRFPLEKNAMSWHFFLYNAAEVDQTAADALFGELLAAHENAIIGGLVLLSGYPFGNPGSYGITKSSMYMNVPANYKPNPALQRQFIALLVGKTLALQPDAGASQGEEAKYPEASVAVSLWIDLEPIVLERFPELIQRVSAAKTHASALMTTETAAGLDSRLKSRDEFNAPFEKRLESLEKEANPDKLDYLIVQLVQRAKDEPELARAEKWLSKISDEKVREQTTGLFFFKRTDAAIKENRLEDAEKYAEKIPELEFRAIQFFNIAAARLKAENDKMRAADVLERVVAAAMKAPNGVERAQVLLGTAYWFEKYNHYRAADVLSEAVKTANRLENPDFSVPAVHRKIEGKKFGVYSVYSMPGYDLEKSFSQVAAKDFEGSLAWARALDDKFLRTLAVIAVVSDCAAGGEKREPKKQPTPKTRPNKNVGKAN